MCQTTLDLKDKIENSFLILGESLWKIREERMWEGQWTSFGEFLMEMKMSEPTASKLINIWAKFVMEFGINPFLVVEAGGWGNVAEILPVVKDKLSAEEWLGKAKVLTREDLRTEIRIAKGGTPPEDCSHGDSYTIKVCRTCGTSERIYEN